jgi:hypothetical protein
MDSFEKFTETFLPPKEAFYNQMTQEHISDYDFAHACDVWKSFNMKTMRDYHNLYLRNDVLLLADVFENFRKLALTHNSLDPSHYITLPSYSWDACLKYTKVELDLLSDPDMYNFFEKGIRGGVSMISTRHAKANNPMCDDYNPDEKNSWIMYWDANNLYGWAMNESLPMSDFKWLSQKKIEHIDFTTLHDNDATGYILEVDLEYPNELHDLHTDYPLAPERLELHEYMLSPYSIRLNDKKARQGGKVNSRPYAKEKLHHSLSKLAISLGSSYDLKQEYIEL